VEFAARAGNKNAAGCTPFAIFHPLHDARRLAAFGQSVLFVVSIIFLRSAVFAIFAMSLLQFSGIFRFAIAELI
jgi:hypothetical protein